MAEFQRIGLQYLAMGTFLSHLNSVRRYGAGLAALGLAIGLAIGLSGSAPAATAANAQSPLGMNLVSINYYTVEQPFLNIVKTAALSSSDNSGWITHNTQGGAFNTNENAYLQLDANGYPTTLTPSSADPNPQFNSVGVLLLRNLGQANAGTGIYYPSGQYVVLYDGQGTLSYNFDASLASSTPGRDVLNVNATGAGIMIFITSTDPNHTGNYIRNLRLVKAEQECLLASGAIFNPKFLNMLANFRLVRGMQWLNSDSEGGLLVNWSSRPQLTDAGYGGAYGGPIEAVLLLCNAVGADCWINVPHLANNDYITQMATLAHSMLGTSQKLYIEFSNEVWNPSFAQFHYAVAQGQAMWPTAAGEYWGADWYGMRTAQTCDIWKSVWGADAARVVCVMGAQAGNAFTATTALQCSLWSGAPCSGHGMGAVAVAPYFAGTVTPQAAWAALPDNGLTALFAAINGGDLQSTSYYEGLMMAAIAPFKLPLISYEGGESLVANPVYPYGSPIANLYIAAQRDPRMAQVYATALANWKAKGGTIYTEFADIAPPSVYGNYGALESVWDTVTPLSQAPPKWQALQNFIAENKCWWANCAGTIAAPASPTPAKATAKQK
jgi:hypothetical protein